MILIGTPAYGGNNHMDYTKSIIEFTQTGINFAWYGIGNESLITRARNSCISTFYNNNKKAEKAGAEPYSHLFFLDADIYCSGESYKKLALSGKDIVGAAVRLKSDNIIYNINGLGNQEGDYLEVNRIGTAVLMLSKKVIDDLVHKAIDEGKVYDFRSYCEAEPGNREDMSYEVFKTGIVNEIYHSEDFYLCNDLKEMGYKVYCDTTIKTIHWGTIPFATIEN